VLVVETAAMFLKKANMRLSAGLLDASPTGVNTILILSS
jgi:hypothetical protein